MNKKQLWTSVSLSILYSRKRRTLVLKSFSVATHIDKKTAMGYVYATKGYSYVKKSGDQVIIWDGNPSYSTTLYEFALIGKVAGMGIDFTDKHQLKKFRNLFDEMYNDWIATSGKRIYPDQSLELDRLAWRTSIPKGYKILRVGAAIKEGDIEWTEYYGSKFWGALSHFHIGQKVKKGNSFSVVHFRDGRSTWRGHNEPLIIRRK